MHKKVIVTLIAVVTLVFLSIYSNAYSEVASSNAGDENNTIKSDDSAFAAIKRGFNEGMDDIKSDISWVMSLFKSAPTSTVKENVANNHHNGKDNAASNGEEKQTNTPLAKQAASNATMSNSIKNATADSITTKPPKNVPESQQENGTIGSKIWSGIKTGLLFIAKVGLVLIILACLFMAPLLTTFSLLLLVWFGDYSLYTSGWKIMVVLSFVLIAIGEYSVSKTDETLIKKIISAVIIFFGKVAILGATLGPVGIIGAIVSAIIFFYLGYILAAIIVLGGFLFGVGHGMVTLGLMNDAHGYFLGNPSLSTWHFLWLVMFVLLSIKTIMSLIENIQTAPDLNDTSSE